MLEIRNYSFDCDSRGLIVECVIFGGRKVCMMIEFGSLKKSTLIHPHIGMHLMYKN